jgi:foldase protein PrsA
VGYKTPGTVNLVSMRRIALVFIAASALFLGGCGQLLEPAAAVVRENKITVNEIDSALDDFESSPEFQRLAEQNDSNAIRKQFEQGYLAVLIRREVLRAEAEKMNIEVTDAELDEQIEQIRAGFDSPQAFEEAMEERGLTLELLRERVRDSQYEDELRAKVVDEVAPSEDELRAEYESRKAQYQQMRASHILFKPADKVVAQGVADQLQSASDKELPALFKQMSTEYTIDKVAEKKGGDLGFFLPGQFDPKFVAAAQDLSVGEVSDPVKTDFGWHVIYLTDRRTLSFEEARKDFEDELTVQTQDEAWREWLLSVYRAAEVKVNPRYGEFDEETQQITSPDAGDVPGTKKIEQKQPDEAPQPQKPG